MSKIEITSNDNYGVFAMFYFQDHMWQYKQEERELKRVEGDIIKNQRAVRHTLRDFENSRLFHGFLLVLYKKYTLPTRDIYTVE